jgi:hypothetical protein
MRVAMVKIILDTKLTLLCGVVQWYPVAANNEATEPRIILVELFSSFRKRCGRHHDLVNPYGIYVSQMTTDVFHLS